MSLKMLLRSRGGTIDSVWKLVKVLSWIMALKGAFARISEEKLK